jgi:hypothetical protein
MFLFPLNSPLIRQMPTDEARALLGGKGAGLATMQDLGLPVPPAFILSTEVCNFYYANNEQFPQNFTEMVHNAIAEIDILSATIKKIMPLGFKDYSAPGNAFDLSDRDGMIAFKNAPVFGTYMPDAIASHYHNGETYLFTANEGDAREYAGFTEIKRLGTVMLDPVAFPTGAALKTDAQLGRLNITTTLGDKDNDGDLDAIYSFGARSFSVWNASTGALVWDSKNELDVKSNELGVYDDGRSDDKGAEPEAITIGRVGSKTVAYVGLERVDAVAVYDITEPTKPVFVKMFKTGDAPEGLLFIPASKSPIGQSLVVVSSENDGLVKIYKANKL